ncbi:MAG TPA: peptide-methionine (R)-S-oxide reductase MsrB [Caulobacterales bacterium]|nr:peptide-methionine (R)-S-oxide reductase MsrB [Caulobacterales bacterium]
MANALTRRALFVGAALLPLLACSAEGQTPPRIPRGADDSRFADSPWRRLTAQEWRARLSPEAFHILREEGTERTFTSPLLDEHRRGTFVCAGCALPLFSSDWKYDSGTGWPSFFRSMEQNLATSDVAGAFDLYREVHCAQCLGHQGHVFTDGPRPTGLRYCIDGVALRFAPA